MKWAIFFILTHGLAAQTAADFYQQARRTEDKEQRLVLLQRALELDAESGAIHLRLAETLLELKRFAEAAPHYARAISRISTANPDAAKAAKAKALLGWASALYGQGEFSSALNKLKESVALGPSTEAESLIVKIMSIRGEKALNAEEIAKSLVAEEAAADGSTATIDLVINFDTDEDTLTTEGLTQAIYLADAIKTMEGKRFLIVGHTDRHGPDEHNQDLSERRARRVTQFLITRGVARERVKAEGRGKTELLITAETIKADATNRRVEVRLLP